MTVCKVEACPYYSNGFCSNRLTKIDINGMCSQIWYKGSQRDNAFSYPKNPYKEVIKVTEVSAIPVTDEAPPQEEYHQITFDEYLAELEQKSNNT